MAASSKLEQDDYNRCTVLNKFQIFFTQIALEITSVETKIIKSLIRDLLPERVVDEIDVKEKLPALDLFARLQEYRKLSENNLELLKEILETAGRKDLLTRVQKFEKEVTELGDAPQSQMEHLKEQNTVLLRLLLSDRQRSEELTQKTNSLRESVCKRLGLDLKDVAFVTTEDANFPDCVFVVFQFPNLEPKIMDLNCDALNRATWLVRDGVLQLQVGDKASINIKENLQDIKPIPRRQTSVLVMNESFSDHRDDTLDVFLGIELSSLVNDDIIRQLHFKCQSGINIVSQHLSGLDVKLGVVTYGNHCQNSQQPVAFSTEALSKDLDIMICENQSSRGEGCSGMSDAVKKVSELAGVRKDATKICIVFTFLNQKSRDPEYYRCSHGNDIIKLCYAMAKAGISLYIIGINTTPSPSNEENHFLNGITAISGGLYLEVEDLDSLDKLIPFISKHDMSIEKHGKDTCKALIDEINRKFGIVNIHHLGRFLKHFLNRNGKGINGIKTEGQNANRSAKESRDFRQLVENMTLPLTQIAQRIAVADDLDDAVRAFKTMSLRLKANKIIERGKAHLRSCSAQTSAGLLIGGGFPGVLMEECEGDSSKAKLDICVDNVVGEDGDSAFLVENEEVDLEVATRMVRRHLHRLEYQKINEEPVVE